MIVTFVPLPVPDGASPTWECTWCGSVASDRTRHAQWHWGNESRSIGDASASGLSITTEPALTVETEPAAELLPDPLTSPLQMIKTELRRLGLLDTRPLPFPVPVLRALPLEEQRGE